MTDCMNFTVESIPTRINPTYSTAYAAAFCPSLFPIGGYRKEQIRESPERPGGSGGQAG